MGGPTSLIGEGAGDAWDWERELATDGVAFLFTLAPPPFRLPLADLPLIISFKFFLVIVVVVVVIVRLHGKGA